MEIDGLEQAKKEFKRIQQASRKFMKAVLKPASQVVRDEARRTSAFVDRSGVLRKAIRTKMSKAKRDYVKYKVGPDPKKAPHAHLVESGHVLARKNSKGQIVAIGHVPPHPFMRPAIARTEGTVTTMIQKGIFGRIL